LGHPMLFSGCGLIEGSPYVEPINDAFEQRVVELVNIHRAESDHQLPPLKRFSQLDYVARYHADDMATDNYFNHSTYDGYGGTTLVCGTWDRINSFLPPDPTYPYWWRGENIAAGYSTPEAVMEGWINSTGHHSNITKAIATEIGVGYYTGPGHYGRYWVQDFYQRRNVYPIIINREAAATSSQQVSLYIYGADTWDQMRLRSDNGTWTNWQTFQTNFTWNLPCASGLHTVSVEMRDNGQTEAGAAYSDSITLNLPAGVTLGSLPASISFLYGKNSGELSVPAITSYPQNTASCSAVNWTVTKSGFESDWLTLSTATGVSPSGFTAIPHNVGGIYNLIGDHTGTLTIEASSADPGVPGSATATIPVHFIVVNDLLWNFMPLVRR
jgi:uncharacterized protein YkwD